MFIFEKIRKEWKHELGVWKPNNFRKFSFCPVTCVAKISFFSQQLTLQNTLVNGKYFHRKILLRALRTPRNNCFMLVTSWKTVNIWHYRQSRRLLTIIKISRKTSAYIWNISFLLETCSWKSSIFNNFKDIRCNFRASNFIGSFN